ncbi:MAG: transcriptional regulator [Methanophagales archaeon ANME-1-THS]|nr:MAG: transcriptional regulator [Methanophagales archaeon ANME-1-THS]
MPLEDVIGESLKKSLKTRFKERRSKLEIIAAILSAALKGAKKTEIVYKANINFRRFDEFINFLTEKELIERTDGEYKTTSKGKEFLTDYQQVNDHLLTER